MAKLPAWPTGESATIEVLRRILIPIVLLIVYGSLYPWHFRAIEAGVNPLWILLHSWSTETWRAFLRDTIINISLYIPLGFAAHLAFRKSRLPGFSIYGPVLVGFVLSTSMELMQLLVPMRHTSIDDLITNVIGSGCGVLAGLLFETVASRHEFRPFIPSGGVADRAALMLAFCWVGWLFFPLFPVISLPLFLRKVVIFEHSRVLDPAPLVSGVASWFAAGRLATAAAGERVPRVWFLLTLLAIPAQLFVAEQQPVSSFLVGAMAGAVLFEAGHRSGTPTIFEALAFLMAIVVRGLAPFHFAAEATEFIWIPFGATLASEWQSALRILSEKVFYYGTAVWLLRAAGLTLVRAVILVAVTLASIEIAQIHLPGRTPEITDPILAILLGFLPAMLSREREKRFRSAG